MISYSTEQLDNVTYLYRVTKRSKSLICQVMTGTDGRVLIVDEKMRDTYRFRCEGLQLIKVNSQYVAAVNDDIKVFAKPNSMTLHNEIMRVNRLRYYLGGKVDANDAETFHKYDLPVLDTERIVNDMLECIATV